MPVWRKRPWSDPLSTRGGIQWTAPWADPDDVRTCSCRKGSVVTGQSPFRRRICRTESCTFGGCSPGSGRRTSFRAVPPESESRFRCPCPDLRPCRRRATDPAEDRIPSPAGRYRRPSSQQRPNDSICRRSSISSTDPLPSVRNHCSGPVLIKWPTD